MLAKIKSCFNGCSFTWGEGFDSNERDLYVYDRLVTRKLKWDHDNIAQKGSSNYQIFMRSADAVQSGDYDIVFTQWSGLNRIWLSPGPDTFYFTHDEKYPDYRYRDVYIDAGTKKTLNSLLLILNHDYCNILDLIGYCSILESLGKNTNTKIIFINGLVPWQSDLITPLGRDLGNSLSEYTKSILDFDNRSDNEITKYFSVLQEKMSLLNQRSWVNLFDSFQHNSVDVATEGHHPGPASHAWMADKIVNYLKINGIT
jgi:hypothetical protein